MIPIGEQHGPYICVVVGAGWSIDDDRACKTLGVLDSVMRVVPRCSVLRCAPGIGQSFPGCKGALRDSIHTILLEGIQLSDSVPVDRRSANG